MSLAAGTLSRAAHRARVMALYKKAVRSVKLWDPKQEIWAPIVGEIRYKFEENAHLTNKAQIDLVYEEGSKKISEWHHGINWNFIYRPGGVGYLRYYDVIYNEAINAAHMLDVVMNGKLHLPRQMKE
eukprot:TRINITY_DN19004_c0_g1_i1.p2 TRINITY_DN19004_c0_g1~~TRINITY_DN19004_c0_g1_i1.p2  ORF type:complete len:127 (-),score=29.80 TRINITY_DN19004_c0_g1_i1:84-464(-)